MAATDGADSTNASPQPNPDGAGMWLRFAGVAAIWGSSTLLMKLATNPFARFNESAALPDAHVGPATVTAVRLIAAALIFAGFLAITKRGLPRRPGQWLALVFIGVFNTAVPFTLITWASGRLDSSLSTILIGTTPFFALTIAHFALPGESLNWRKGLGLLLGMVGVSLLAMRAVWAGETGAFAVLARSDEAGFAVAAMLGATMCYAVSLTVIRRTLRDVEPIRIAGYSVMVGAAASALIPLLLAEPMPAFTAWPASLWGLCVMLGLVHTVVAYFLFYSLISVWGPRASLVTYAMPAVGVGLGVVVAGEAIDWRMILGAVAILCGIILAQRASKPAGPAADQSR